MQDKTKKAIREIIEKVSRSDFKIHYRKRCLLGKGEYEIDRALSAIETLVEKDRMNEKELFALLIQSYPNGEGGNDFPTYTQFEKLAKALHNKL